MKYRSKPVEIEALHWVQSIGGHEADLVVAWIEQNGGEARYERAHTRIAVRTINGWAYAAPGHYIVMGDARFHGDPTPYIGAPYLRDFYPCDPETFERRWEPVR